MKSYSFTKYLLMVSFTIFFSCSKESNSDPVISNNNQETQVVTFDVDITSSEGGTVNTSSGSYNQGTVLNIQANANEGYAFLNWEGFDSTNPSITINVNQNYTLNAVFIIEEEVSLDQNAFTDNVEVNSGNVFQGSITPNSTTTFEVENADNLIAVVDNGFGLDLSVPDNTQGALIQFKNVDGDLADSYIQIERFPDNSSKSLRSSKKSRFKHQDKKETESKTYNKNSTGQFSFDIDFGEGISAGQICFNVHIYDDNDNISAGIEICVTINNFGGGPNEIHGIWEYYQEGTEGENLNAWGDYGEEPYQYSYYVGDERVEINGCFDPSCNAEVCYNEEGEFQGYAKISNLQERDYIILNPDGSYEDRYETIISQFPEIVGSIDLCLEDEYDGDLFKFAKNPYQTTVTNVYYGKWSYDEATGTIGIFDYSDQTLDSGGTLLSSSLEVYDEPYDYFSNGTFVEVNGDTMTLREPSSYSDDVYITVFRRIQ